MEALDEMDEDDILFNIPLIPEEEAEIILFSSLH